MKPRIGISAANDPKSRGLYASVNRYYTESVARAGGLPLVVPPLDDLSLADDLLAGLDGLILSGGADVDPGLYGQEPHPSVKVVDRQRDDWERALLGAARSRGTPILAICRGCQLVNVALGGTLIQDLPTQKPGPVDHLGPEGSMEVLTHRIRVEAGPSRLKEVFGEGPVEVNSFHHQAVGTLAPGLKPTAWSEDGVLEGFEAAEGSYLVAVQFHPEALTARSESFTRLFRSLVDEARR